MKNVYLFGSGITEGSANQQNILGGKGANLAEMSNLKIPVPPGFTIPTHICNHFLKNRKLGKNIQTAINNALTKIEKILGKNSVTPKTLYCYLLDLELECLCLE